MILTCSSCDAKYLVDSHQIKYGRHVKCIRGGNILYYDNKDYNASENIIENKEEIKSNINKNKGNANLPVIYKGKKNNYPLILKKNKDPMDVVNNVVYFFLNL